MKGLSLFVGLYLVIIGIGTAEANVYEASALKIISWPVMGTAKLTAGTGGFFLIRVFRERANHRDSLITAVESEFKNAAQLFSEKEYAEASQAYRSVLEDLSSYLSFERHIDPPEGMDSASITEKIGLSDFLHETMEFIHQFKDDVAQLPDTEQKIILQDRREIKRSVAQLKDTLKSVKTNSPRYSSVLNDLLKKSISDLNRVDTLLLAAYPQEQLDFDLKSRFYYNRAVESNDTSVIRRYVEDCDYYQIERRWCEKARVMLEQKAVATQLAPDSIDDPVRSEYLKAMESGKLSRLEAFIDTYSASGHSVYKSLVDSAKDLRMLFRNEMEDELAFSRRHPLFFNADFSKFGITVEGADSKTEEKIFHFISENNTNLRNVARLRFPAGLSIDLTTEMPMITLTAFISCERDVEKEGAEGNYMIELPGVLSALNLLTTFRNFVVKEDLQEHIVKKLNASVFAVRLRKNNDKFITLYAKTTVDGVIDWYNLVDITKEGENVRVYDQTYLPDININANTDCSVSDFFSSAISE
ncbi:hypothetical protein QA601_10930 [Chitinispirillales bacterium ANBcel5]|uniref:hypothetical protein n=1 Tax=Cellulosispirillum alkaliphilum TaxID=3039283 RepID=UPI002A512E5D|nr:hypothetical protein [Chitinispirillales bacterium ANBcel5]